MASPHTQTNSIPVDTLSAEKGKAKAFFELTKPRLSMMTVITAIVGYMLADPQRSGFALLGLILGTTFSAGGAAALNQWWERASDALMARTRGRPIPAGVISPEAALIFGITISLLGVGALWWINNWLAALLSAATIGLYVFVYTPMKRWSSWNTAVGAIPGAIPPLIGWAAAEGAIGLMGWILFGIILFWQIPHFMAIAWTHRKDYAAAGYRMVTTDEPSGRSAAVQSFVCTVLLVGFTLTPVFLGFASWFYGAAALLGGAPFMVFATQFLRHEPRDMAAKKLFFTSISHLPLVLSALVLDVWILG
ncbi:MAG: heme o synthase [Opitutales bacterium]|nr:heme o synthase [Opitutales bacterium]